MEEEKNNFEEEQENEPKGEQLKPSGGGFKRYAGWMVLAVVLVIGGIYGFREYEYLETHVDTDDAQTNGYISPVLPRVSGYVDKVYIKDNERVQKGQLLVEIDSTEYVLNVQKAQSALENAIASLEVAKSSRQTAEVSLQKAREDFSRAKDLYQGGATTKQSFDDVKATLTKSKSNLQTAKKKVEAARTRITEKENTLADARLKLSYTEIKAPTSGVVSKKDVQVGELIKPGQPLMSITDKKDVWVIANYKETQIQYIKVGQQVEIAVDAYPDKKFKGRVQSIAGGTGAKYSLLPPENATGNFVKVVQRVPVKITLNEKKSARDKLRLGLNVTATIDITQKVDSSDRHRAMETAGK